MTNAKKVMRTCKICGKEFEALKKSRATCCSRSCALKVVKTLVCKICGKEFTTTSPSRLYCSDGCRGRGGAIAKEERLNAKEKAKLRGRMTDEVRERLRKRDDEYERAFPRSSARTYVKRLRVTSDASLYRRWF